MAYSSSQPTVTQGPHCGGCPHQAKGVRYVPPTGLGQNGVLLLGDSPWVEEMQTGQPFSGAAGAMLDRIIRRIGAERESFLIGNASMNCKPLHLGWSDHPQFFPEAGAAIQHCEPYLEELIEARQPRVIVPLGNAALQRVCGVSGIEQRHSYLHATRWGIPAIPTFHPSYIMQGKHKLSAAVAFALRRAEEIAQGTIQPTEDKLLLDLPVDEIRSYLRQFPQDIPEVLIDIETPESSHLDEEEVEEKGTSFNIIRAGFCLERGVGVTFPFQPPYTEILREVLLRSRLVWEWADNHFDSKRLRANGYQIPGIVASGMWAWHFLQSDMPKSLAFVSPFFFLGYPWKHLSEGEPARYNALDQVRGWDCTKGSQAELEKQGRWQAFQRHCIETEQILTPMTQAGVLLDQTAQDALRLKLESERDASLQQLQAEVPDSVKGRKTWKRPPKDMAGVSLTVYGAPFSIGEAGLEVSEELFWQGVPDDCPPEYRTGKAFRKEFSRVEPFNPDSSPQVAALIRHLGLKVPMDRTTKKPTTGEKHLRRFAKTRPIFRTILDCRKRTKLIGTYLWTGDSVGRIRGTYGFHPSTWRKSQKAYNLQTIPKRGPLAGAVRQTIIAAPGHVLIEYDSSGIEAVLVGWFAQSPRYTALAKAGIHGWLTSCVLGKPIPLSLPFDELQKQCKAMKRENPKLYDQCKPIIHGSAYLESAEGIWYNEPDLFETPRDAKKLQDMLLKTEPWRDVAQWQKDTCERAHKETLLKNPFGYWHRFYDVFTFDRKSQSWKPGEDAKRCVAFLPQSTASALQTEILLWLRDNAPWLLPYLRLIVHDSIISEVPEEKAQEVCLVMQEAFTQSWPQLDGLSIGAEGSIGRNLRSYSPENPDGMREAAGRNKAATEHSSTERVP